MLKVAAACLTSARTEIASFNFGREHRRRLNATRNFGLASTSSLRALNVFR
jgi:hypothetical protein